MLSDHFDKVFVMNLDRRPDRRKNIEAQKDITGETTFVSAFDGLTLTTKPGLPPNKSFSQLSMGSYGNLLTHRAIIKYAKENNLGKILILEDDVVFTCTNDDIDEYIEALPSNVDMIYFGGNHMVPPVKIDNKVSRCVTTLTTHAIGLTYGMYDEILHRTSDLNLPIDVSYTFLQQIYNVYCPTECLATQLNGFSDIENRNVDYSSVIK